MKIIGIDYGRSKVGVSVSVNGFVEPFKVIRAPSYKECLDRLAELISIENPEKIVVGISEGKMAKEIEDFADDLAEITNGLQIDLFDETLSTQDAQTAAREVGIGRKKLKEKEDAYAATVMLQNYLHSLQK